MKTGNRGIHRFFQRLLAAALAVFLLSFPVHGAPLYDELAKDEDLIEETERVSDEILMWRDLILSLPEERPEYAPSYTFWWGNLDDESSYELIIRAAVTDPGYQETLLVYDIRETDEGLEPEFLFEEPPYVQIRSSFSGDQEDGSMHFWAVTVLAIGECVEGKVCLNDERTALEYTVTRTYQMAGGETASPDLEDISGQYDLENPENTNWGPLDAEVLMRHDFTLGEDNNWFSHTIIEDDPRSGFAGLDSLKVTEDHYAILTAGAGEGIRSDIDNTIEKEFGGVCLGLSSLIGHVQAGSTAVTEFEEDAEQFFDLGKPSENETLFERISFLQLMQQRLDQKEDYDGFVHYRWLHDEADDLKALVESISEDKWQLLTFMTRHSGHALLVTRLAHFPLQELYQLTFYDVNSINAETFPEGKIYSMFIKDDFSSFFFRDANGERIDESNCVELSLIDTDVLLQKETEFTALLAAIEQAKEDMAEALDNQSPMLSYSPAYEIFCETLDGAALTYKDGVLYWEGSGDPVLPGIVNTTADGESRSYCRAVFPTSDSFTLRCDPEGADFSLRTSSGYCSVSGTGIDAVTYSEEDGLTLTGENAAFEAALCIHDGDTSWLSRVSGSGSGRIHLSDAGGTLQVDAENPVRLDEATAVQGAESTRLPLSQEASTLTLSKDGGYTVDGQHGTTPAEEGDSEEAVVEETRPGGNATLLVILLVAILVLVASILAFFLMKRKR